MIDYTNSFIISLLPSTEDLFYTSYKIKESNFTKVFFLIWVSKPTRKYTYICEKIDT